MKRFWLGLALGLLPAAALADGLDKAPPEGRGPACGGDAYSFAEVAPARRGVRARGPIVVLPETLCADLGGGPATRIESLNVFIDPRGASEEQPQTGLPGRKTPYRLP